MALSDLGNIIFNPRGAIFYNLGLIFTGVIIFLFFIGINDFIDEFINRKYFKLIQGLGYFTAISLALIGVFPENAPFGLHGLWSLIFFIFVGIDILITCILIYFEEKLSKWVIVVGLIIFSIDLILGMTMHPFAEFSTVIAAMVYVEIWVVYFFKFWDGG